MKIEIRRASTNELVSEYNSLQEYLNDSPIAGLSATTFNGKHLTDDEFCDLMNEL